MLGEKRRPGKFWKICWQYISPLILLVIILNLHLSSSMKFLLHMSTYLFFFTVYNHCFLSILSRCNTWWLYISTLGTYTWLDCCNSMPYLAPLYFSSWNMSSWNMECMLSINLWSKNSLSIHFRLSKTLVCRMLNGVRQETSIVNFQHDIPIILNLNNSVCRLYQQSILARHST